MNSKLLYLPLKELQEYMSNLEIENERLRNELAHMSRLNCILENIRRSSGKGFTAMQNIDRNKCCRCNEHLNVHLRRAAQEAEIERMVWEEQYDKLFHSAIMSKHEPMVQINDDSVSSVHSSRSSSDCVSYDEPMIADDNDSEHESMANSSNTDQRPCSRSISRSTSNTDVNGSSKDEDNATKSDDTLPHYSDSDSGYDSSPVMVVFDSTKKLPCDWPNCHQVFTNEEVLIHHRRNHIRKSRYHCEYCSERLLNKEDLEAHIAKHLNVKVKEEEDSSECSNTPPPLNRNEDVFKTKLNSIENCSQSVNHLNNSRISEANAFGDDFSKSARMESFSFHSSLNGTVRTPKAAPNNFTVDSIAGNSMRPEEYKRTRYSGVGRYRCPWPDCGYTPHFLRDLRRHMHKHTGDKKHKCDYPGCDFVSVWKTSLLQHQRKKHLAVISANESVSHA